MDIKPIETAYKGYRFRSRLEARWAVFFDALKLRWEYEKEGFVLADGTKYLPDFWLPDTRLWVEIKPNIEPGWQGTPVYLAGPMTRPDWRDSIRNVYQTGPERVKGHGVEIHGDCYESEPGCRNGSAIVERCLKQIAEATELWAWIPDTHRYGTILEIGYAKALGKKIRVAIHGDALLGCSGITSVGSFGNIEPGHGEFQAHEMWFAERCADEVLVPATSLEQAAKWFNLPLSPTETKCAMFSKQAPLILLRGVPGELDRPCTLFGNGKALWRGWFPGSFWPLNSSPDHDCELAFRAARSARFEHGETPCPR